MKVYVVSQGNEEFHRVETVESDWNLAMKFAFEELDATEEMRTNRREREGQTVWECWTAHDDGHGGVLTRITQLDLS